MRHASILATVVLVSCLLGCEQKSFSQKYGQLSIGMSQGDAERILGKGTKQDLGGVGISASGIAGGASQNSQITYIWQDGSKEISIIYKDNKVISLSKAGF